MASIVVKIGWKEVRDNFDSPWCPLKIGVNTAKDRKDACARIYVLLLQHPSVIWEALGWIPSFSRPAADFLSRLAESSYHRSQREWQSDSPT